jgi:hypothetical protein
VSSHYASKKFRFRDCSIREARKIELCLNNMNRDDVFSLSRSRKPLILNVKEQNQGLTKDSTCTFIQPSSLSRPY